MPEPIHPPLAPDQAALTRIRPKQNEWRYYRLEIWPDLFGRTLLARHWGRIGTKGRYRLGGTPTPTQPPPSRASTGHAGAWSSASITAATCA